MRLLLAQWAELAVFNVEDITLQGKNLTNHDSYRYAEGCHVFCTWASDQWALARLSRLTIGLG